jgi:hypothetical protein
MPAQPPSAKRLYDQETPAGAERKDFKDLTPEERAPFEARAREARADYNAKLKALGGAS